LIYNLFSDGTNVQKFGTLSYHPIFLTLGNIEEEERKKDSGYRLVGLIPSLNGTDVEKATEKFREDKAAIFQQCYRIFMSSFEEPSQKGAYIPDSKGDLYPVYPFFGYLASDWPEG